LKIRVALACISALYRSSVTSYKHAAAPYRQLTHVGLAKATNQTIGHRTLLWHSVKIGIGQRFFGPPTLLGVPPCKRAFRRDKSTLRSIRGEQEEITRCYFAIQRLPSVRRHWRGYVDDGHLPRTGRAQYPDHTIYLITSLATGSASNVALRIVAEKLGSAFHQSIVIDNQTGASGAIGIVAPRATPDAAVNKLSTALDKILRDPDTVKRFFDQGIDPFNLSPTDMGAYMTADYQRMTKVVHEAGMDQE
jgi:hypothetical protein